MVSSLSVKCKTSLASDTRAHTHTRNTQHARARSSNNEPAAAAGGTRLGDPPAPATAGPRRGWKATARTGPDAHLLRAQHVFTEVTVCPAQPRDKPTHHRGETYAGGGSRGATKSRPRRQASYDPSGGLARKAVLLRGPRARSGTRGSGARGFPQQRRPSEDRAGPRRGVSAVRPVGTLDAWLERSKSNSPRAKQHLQSPQRLSQDEAWSLLWEDETPLGQQEWKRRTLTQHSSP